MARLQVMTWNVQNLFLPEHEDGPDTEEAFDEKLASLAGVIDRAAPDVAALQEIGPDVLGRLQAALTHRLPHAAVGDPDDRGIRVALLSTRPLAEIGRIRLFPAGVRAVQAKDEVFDDPITANVDESMTLEMGRGALEATVDVDGVPVTLLTAHFNNWSSSHPGLLLLAPAASTRSRSVRSAVTTMTPRPSPDGNLPHYLLDDRVVPRPFCVNRVDTALLTGQAATPCVTLEDQDDLVLGQIGGRQLFMQPAGSTCPVTPPAAGTTAHDVRAVDDQNLYPASIRSCATLAVGRKQPRCAQSLARASESGRSGRSLREERRYSNSSACPGSDQESRSARVSSGLAFLQMAWHNAEP